MDSAADDFSAWENKKSFYLNSLSPLPKEVPHSLENTYTKSQFFRFSEDLLNKAIELSISKNYLPDSEKAHKLLYSAYQISQIIGPSCYSPRLPMDEEETKNLSSLDLFRHLSLTHSTPAHSLVGEAKRGKEMVVDFDNFQRGVGVYLDSPLRSPVADRMMLVALFDKEITAYLFHIFGACDPTKNTPIRMWLLGRFWSFIRLGIAISIIFLATYFQWISNDTAALLFFGAIGLFALWLLISFPLFFIYKNAWKKNYPALIEIPTGMRHFYQELHGVGPLNIARVRKLAESLAEKGAVWPGAAWALLGDIESRGVINLGEIT